MVDLEFKLLSETQEAVQLFPKFVQILKLACQRPLRHVVGGSASEPQFTGRGGLLQLTDAFSEFRL